MRVIILFFSVFWSLGVQSQALMNIHRASEPILQIAINDIDSITYTVVGDPGALPIVTTLPLGAYTATTAELGGIVDANGGTSITQRGVVWSVITNPTTADSITQNGVGTGTFLSLLSDLSVDSSYYARAYAINNAGTAYGNEIIFQVTSNSFVSGDGVIDIDGNSYQTIHSSTGQEWMAENLKTCRYANGDSILHIEDNVAWSVLDSGAWVYMNNNPGNSTTFGKLYNGWAVSDPRNVCPTEWHVPSEAEWSFFHSVNGGLSNGGGNMKIPGIAVWLTPNTGATNSSGFSALPGGKRIGSGDFQEHFGGGFWWASSGTSFTLDTRSLYYTSNGVWTGAQGKTLGLSIRCVKD